MPKSINYVTVDQSRFQDAIHAYFLWKELNTIIKTSHTRGVNIHEAITESILCHVSGFKLNRGSGSDAFDEKNNLKVEIKATSNYDSDTTSFSPSEKFDLLYFVRLDQRNDIMYFYNLNISSEDLKQISVSKTQTLEDQQKERRRPRFSVIKKLIEKNHLEPYAQLNLRTQRINKY